MSKATEATKKREATMKKQWDERLPKRLKEQSELKIKNAKIYQAGIHEAEKKAKAKRRDKG